MHTPSRTGLQRHAALWRDYPPDLQDAIVDCITEPYVIKSLPREQFAAERHLPIGSAAFDAAWAALLDERRVTLKRAYEPDNLLYTIAVSPPDSTPLVLGTIMWIAGTRPNMIAETIGDPASSLPTFRMLSWPRFPANLGIDPHTTPESRLAELSRLVLRREPELRRYVEAGYLSREDARYLQCHGSDELLARAYFCGRERLGDVAALPYNTVPRIDRWLARKGLIGEPLYLAGATPTPRTLNGPPLLRGYFNWAPLLAPLVPSLAGGITEAIRYLADERPEVLAELSVSLPAIFINDARFEVAMAKLITSCGLALLP